VTKEEGFFDKYGIDAEVLPLPGADRIVAAVVSGEVPITALSATALVNAVLAGADMVFVGSYDNRLRFWLYARPEIASVQELRGKQLAISSRGGIIRRATELALERNGLDPDRDATLLVTGNVTNSLTALLTGNVAGAMFGPPETFRAADEGMRQLVDTTDYNFPMIIQGIAASRAWIAQNQDLTRRVLQAIGEGLAFTHQHKERTKEIIGKYTQSDDALLLERTYNTRVPGFERVPYAPADAIRSDLDMLAEENPAARDARPEQFVDNRFVEELDRAGFFQRLYP
jgi:NitT/TauT family transport system substrate-binding protein